ncbi:hypothetical protein [Hoeflea sp.]|uniref:hypothetical protein n=1 Tax=Hoeflea sp. TaxID=1940281 RepID=UPI003A8E1D5B
MRSIIPLVLTITALTSLFGQPVFAAQYEGIYTLYRNSTLDITIRVHLATFDSDGGQNYNLENCLIAADLFQSQPGVTVKYWCEPGRYRK